ncbi:hypothetical protein V2P36_02105 [Mycoplasmoides gallisepticum]|uniref:hypothetical protein n=1 Tax=Mycoplasmoides gallisepticum TaxID=2096 RepID=UPI00200B5160|nr:hypothetical protein [Mycoplasmoides gallisepticum]
MSKLIQKKVKKEWCFTHATSLRRQRYLLKLLNQIRSLRWFHQWINLLGLSNDYASALVKNVKNLIVEVNENAPYIYGSENVIQVSQVAAIVENNVPLLEMPDTEPKEKEINIAQTIANMVPDGATIEMGVGGLPNLVCEKLKNHNDLGIHT